MERALLTLDRGWTPEEIVEPLMCHQGWTGPKSQHLGRRLEELEALRTSRMGDPDDPRRESIIEAASACFEEERERARQSEQHERVFGRNPW